MHQTKHKNNFRNQNKKSNNPNDFPVSPEAINLNTIPTYLPKITPNPSNTSVPAQPRKYNLCSNNNKH